MPKDTTNKDKKAFALIRNRIVHTGIGPTLAEINKVTGGKSPRSASLVLDRLERDGLIKRENRKIVSIDFGTSNSISTVDVPLVGSIPCGSPMLAEENIETFIPVSTSLAKKGSKYFLLRASGDSMNLAGIKDRDILLVRQQEVAENGDRVVALIDEEATVKLFEKKKDVVILRPKSKNPKHRPIVLTDNCKIQGVVVAVLPQDLF